jgi:hypothetical protein
VSDRGRVASQAAHVVISFDDEQCAAVMSAPTDEELLEELRLLLARRGKLTMSLIEASQFTRHPNAYIRRFGSLTAAYERIGYDMNERQHAAAVRFRRSGKE